MANHGYDMADPEERAEWDKKGGLKVPAVGVEQTEAAAYCASLGVGHRLPTYGELAVASLWFLDTQKRGKASALLKPNLDLKLFESKALWTSTPKPNEPDRGGFQELRSLEGLESLQSLGGLESL